MGGAKKELMKITNKSLKAIMKDGKVNEETLSNFLTKVESIVNSRLLTASSDDKQDVLLLNPNNFLIGH